MAPTNITKPAYPVHNCTMGHNTTITLPQIILRNAGPATSDQDKNKSTFVIVGLVVAAVVIIVGIFAFSKHSRIKARNKQARRDLGEDERSVRRAAYNAQLDAQKAARAEALAKACDEAIAQGRRDFFASPPEDRPPQPTRSMSTPAPPRVVSRFPVVPRTPAAPGTSATSWAPVTPRAATTPRTPAAPNTTPGKSRSPVREHMERMARRQEHDRAYAEHTAHKSGLQRKVTPFPSRDRRATLNEAPTAPELARQRLRADQQLRRARRNDPEQFELQNRRPRYDDVADSRPSRSNRRSTPGGMVDVNLRD